MSEFSLELVGLTDERDEPRRAVQYAVRLPGVVEPVVFGDQEWVKSGAALAEFQTGATIVRRSLTITYGEWEDE